MATKGRSRFKQPAVAQRRRFTITPKGDSELLALSGWVCIVGQVEVVINAIKIKSFSDHSWSIDFIEILRSGMKATTGILDETAFHTIHVPNSVVLFPKAGISAVTWQGSLGLISPYRLDCCSRGKRGQKHPKRRGSIRIPFHYLIGKFLKAVGVEKS